MVCDIFLVPQLVHLLMDGRIRCMQDTYKYKFQFSKIEKSIWSFAFALTASSFSIHSYIHSELHILLLYYLFITFIYYSRIRNRFAYEFGNVARWWWWWWWCSGVCVCVCDTVHHERRTCASKLLIYKFQYVMIINNNNHFIRAHIWMNGPNEAEAEKKTRGK